MDADFWHRKWATKEIGFHESQVNPLLVAHLPALQLAPGSRIFVPLCGKTLDIHWLLSQGYRVAGVELSPVAVEELFAELGVTPTVSQTGALTHYQAEGIDLWQGDIFHLSPETLGPVAAIYDRAALVALPADTRPRYAQHLMTLSGTAPQLLICFEYDQSQMSGPPFSIPAGLVSDYYTPNYQAVSLAEVDVPGGFKGRLPAREQVWWLQPT